MVSISFLKVALASLIVVSFAMFQGSTAVAAATYTLFGDAQLVHPGHNSDTAVQLRSVMTAPQAATHGGIDFDTPPMTVRDLDNLQTDYMFTAGSCGGGAPRFQINVGTPVGTKNIFVYIGPPPNYVGCPANVWRSTDDLLTPISFVDTSQLPGGRFYDTWGEAQARYAGFAVSGIQLVTDGGWAVTGGTQTVQVDNVKINATTYTFEAEVSPGDKQKCKNGGWRNFTTAPGPFKNQGDCVSYFATGGRNKGNG
ncbi:MAG TPA: hypothetical protein VGR87_14055 [Candidatus Limnocylindria bacterium]|jgi:hypothetical protein|nr:hypothetical protein [Candidatus Limnocylindria bacterium]